ncbi:MAG: O-antigen ligase family protein [Alphaproteobacteria bacterium]|nr:O-antigen ligase family protein [Alphaproteobacteria bacterium]
MPDFRPAIYEFLPRFCVFFLVAAVTVGAFTGGIWATLGIGGALISFLALWAADKKPPLPPRTLSLFTLAVLSVFAAEVPLSFSVALSLHKWLELASIFLPLLLLTAPRLQQAAYSRDLIQLLAVTAGFAALLLSEELLGNGMLLHIVRNPDVGLTEYNRGVAHVVIFAFPLFAGLWGMGRKKTAYGLAAALLFPASLTESHTAKLALIAGAACTAAAFYRPVAVRQALAFFACLLAGWPFYAQYAFTHARASVEKMHSSFAHRVEIWDYLSYRIAERPLFGWGLGTTHLLDFKNPNGLLYRYADGHAPHAHNFITGLWVETGAIGLMLGFIFMLLALRKISELRAPLQPFALGCWTASVIVSLFGFDFWTDSLWAAFALSAFLFGILQQQDGIQGAAGEKIGSMRS